MNTFFHSEDIVIFLYQANFVEDNIQVPHHYKN